MSSWECLGKFWYVLFLYFPHGFDILCCGIYLKHCIVIASQESWLGSVENREHAKHTYLYYKDMNDYHFEKSNKMSFLILQLMNLSDI